MADLEERLKKRRTETPEALALRLDTAAAEMAQLPMFD
jgi:guanylate kinase